MKLAFDSSSFMRSDAARPLRVIAEYLEPKERLKRRGIHRTITFFGSARIEQGDGQILDGRDYYMMARDLGKKLAYWTEHKHGLGQRYHILTGGGPGIMEAAHEGAADVNRMLNIGFNINLPHEQRPNPHIPDEQVFNFQYFFMRKFWFIRLAAAMVVFPGGYGTLDELFEILTLIQTRKAKDRPIILFGEEYWQEVINLPMLAKQGLIDDEDLKLVTHVNCVDQAFDFLVENLAQ